MYLLKHQWENGVTLMQEEAITIALIERTMSLTSETARPFIFRAYTGELQDVNGCMLNKYNRQLKTIKTKEEEKKAVSSVPRFLDAYVNNPWFHSRKSKLIRDRRFQNGL